MKKIIKNKDTLYLTGIRGYAMFWVFMIHAFGSTLDFIPLIFNLRRYGGLGVIIFFVLSAYTNTLSLYRSKSKNFFSFLLRRFFKIAPLYFLISIIMFILGGHPGYKEQYEIAVYDLKDLFFHFSFLNFFDSRYAYTLIGVEWPIPIIFFYYFIVYLIFILIIKSKIPKIIAPIFLLIGAFLLVNYKTQLPFYPKGSFTFERYFFYYTLGIYLFFLIHHQASIQDRWSKLTPFINYGIILYSINYLYKSIAITERVFYSFLIAYFFYIFILKQIIFRLVKKGGLKKLLNNLDVVVIVLFFIKYFKTGTPANQDLIIALLTALAILISHSKSLMSKFIFENKFIVNLGTVSYPFYLTHFIILRIFNESKISWHHPTYVIFIYIFILLISSTLHNFLEIPFIKLGKKMSYTLLHKN